MHVHQLKSWPQYFEPVAVGLKTFEIRRNDRLFEVGDVLVLLEWDPAMQKYTGRECIREIAYITDFEQKDGNVVLGLSDYLGELT